MNNIYFVYWYLLFSLIEHLSLFQYDVRGTPKTAVYLLAELIRHDTPVKLSDEHQDFKWVPLDTACKLVGHQTLQVVLKECSAFLQQNHI
jgi:bis(5'-nucleosidyl)-tetraphosphatase